MLPLALDTAEKYVAGAYVVFVALLGIYLAIMALRIDRMRRELGELNDLAERRTPESEPEPEREGVPVG
jgi:hypothetical protein